MTIEELKKRIEEKTIDKSGKIFVCKDRFLADQYVGEISHIFGRPVQYIQEIESYGFAGMVDDGNLSVLVTEKFNDDVPDYTIVITDKSSNPTAIEFPKIEPWFIKDYLHGICDGVDRANLEKLLHYKDIYRLKNEADKVAIFDKPIRNTLFNQFLIDGLFGGLSAVDTFDFIKYVQMCDTQSISKSYKVADIDPLAMVALLLKQFSNMIMVYLQSNPTEANTGLKDKQIWAIKNVCKKYTKGQVFSVYKFLMNIDYRLKTGELSKGIMFDYVLFNVLHLLRSNG